MTKTPAGKGSAPGKKKSSAQIKTPSAKAPKKAKKKDDDSSEDSSKSSAGESARGFVLAAESGLDTCCVMLEEHLEHVAHPTLTRSTVVKSSENRAQNRAQKRGGQS
ncbi:hypothetical protein B0H10DRAFT_2192588 [Mycena sp. CBHHK59/15]|nr:hypothetical protein B0H10DRAFT_2192588 [Mycena sp. CBHHK59/15]